ncbi:hypothetical protein AMPC_28510 [Anaeromyxobacter paludicola]|uniref:Lipoprotein n=2 Tax=Anaeromyxobacter paludicola TaxID=2918171 RepID=A0ABN6NBS3_9BACT|nr:hypothetical protein AMPC_28510 [Anaeromyxobacter paludicola]
MRACHRLTCLLLAALLACGGSAPKDELGTASREVRDRLCAAAWSGYTGHWVYYGSLASCGGSDPDDCGELQCTNTEWSNYCTDYNCPAGYTCTLGSQTLVGPTTYHYCNCIKVQNSVTPVMIPDGTPCANLSGTCQRGACVR